MAKVKVRPAPLGGDSAPSAAAQTNYVANQVSEDLAPSDRVSDVPDYRTVRRSVLGASRFAPSPVALHSSFAVLAEEAPWGR